MKHEKVIKYSLILFVSVGIIVGLIFLILHFTKKGGNNCKNVDCGDHGTCDNGKCDCKSGYTGSNCQNPPTGDNCKNVDCENGGTCDKSSGKCDCINGYTGPNCQIPPKKPVPCSNVECKNGGSCIPITNSCRCINGYTGSDCSKLSILCTPGDYDAEVSYGKTVTTTIYSLDFVPSAPTPPFETTCKTLVVWDHYNNKAAGYIFVPSDQATFKPEWWMLINGQKVYYTLVSGTNSIPMVWSGKLNDQQITITFTKKL